MIVKSGSAVWSGSLKEGKGSVSTESGALKDQPYGFAIRFEGKTGTNPEELIGAAHASCFSMALSNILGQEGIVPEKIATTSKVTLDMTDGPKVTKVHLVTEISAPADADKILECAEKAKAGCPISQLLNAEITMDAKVV
ncbi:OsmC family protein [Frigidibacter sp. MR17.14]|uniref:OsmC family protein n=1 Tax=Frigidibacter sp. MR17.14 TaxID=3126509 RepID=UPI003012A84C